MALMGAKGFGRFEAVLKAGLVFIYVHEKNCLELEFEVAWQVRMDGITPSHLPHPPFPRRKPHVFFEKLVEIGRLAETELKTDFLDGLGRVDQ